MGLRKAIITGSINYKEHPLQFPKMDIELMTNTLIKRCKFSQEDIKAILHADDTGSFIKNISDTCEKLNKEKTNQYDLVLFYYSGHGYYDENKGSSFLQISDNTSIDIKEIIEIITQIKAKNKYIIIDACQSGSYSLFNSKGKKERKFVYNSEGLYFLFGTTKDLSAYEPTNKKNKQYNIKNSYFTYYICKALNTKSLYQDNTISIKIVDDYACKETEETTNFDQIPVSTTKTSGYFPLGFWEETDTYSDISEWDNTQDDTIDQYQENDITANVDYLVSEIHEFYNMEKPIFLIDQYQDIIKKLPKISSNLLNDKLDLPNKTYKNKPLINGLIELLNTSQEKLKFLIFLLEATKIDIDLQLVDNSNRSCLMEAIDLNDSFQSSRILKLLFLRGYILSDSDKNYLKTEFNNPQTDNNKKEKILISTIYHKLKNRELILKVSDIEKILFTIYSIKCNKIIGFGFNNFTALANNALTYYNNFYNVFHQALKCYNEKYHLYDELRKKTSFLNKEQNIINNMPHQKTEYNDIFKIVFPEIFLE